MPTKTLRSFKLLKPMPLLEGNTKAGDRQLNYSKSQQNIREVGGMALKAVAGDGGRGGGDPRESQPRVGAHMTQIPLFIIPLRAPRAHLACAPGHDVEEDSGRRGGHG